MDFLSTLVEMLRKPERPPNASNVPTVRPGTPSGRPLDQRRRGYQLAAQEAAAMGEPMPSYEQWIASQSPEM